MSKLPFSLLLILFTFFGSPLLAQHNHEHIDGLHHWEIPSKDPDRIILTFHGDPASRRAVTWRTDSTVTKAFAQIAEATVNSSFVMESDTLVGRY